MTPADVVDWLDHMKTIGRAQSDADCARLLKVTPNVICRWKKRGADHRTALACAALARDLRPWAVVYR